MVWIRTISWEDSEGDLRAAYDWQASRLGAPAEFTMLGSLYPPIVEERLRLYRAVEGCPSALTAEERLLAAFVTSLLNGTTHCASGLRHRLLDEGWTLAVAGGGGRGPGQRAHLRPAPRRDRGACGASSPPSPMRSRPPIWTHCELAVSATSSSSISTTSLPTTTTSTVSPMVSD